jgi:hypothetical protein
MITKKKVKKRDKLALISMGVVLVIYGFYSYVLVPINNQAFASLAEGKIDANVPASRLATITELPFLKSQSQSSTSAIEFDDGVFYTPTEKIEEIQIKTVIKTPEIQINFITIAKKYYKIGLITDQGAAVNGVFRIYGEAIQDVPSILAKNKVVVKLWRRAASDSVTLLVGDKALALGLE